MLIASACVGIGLAEVQRLAECERLWRDWFRLLQMVYTELRYTARPLQDILAAADCKRFPSLGWLAEFRAAEWAIPQGLSAREAAFAEGFFGFVGSSDLEGQLAHVMQYTERAREHHRAAAQRRKRLTKVYLSTSVCAGLSIGIMML